jgi:hypothetical protein
MARDSHSRSDSFTTEDTGGLLAEEDEFDRRMLWRLGSWAAVSVGAVVMALLANQTSIGMRREQIASADLARQSQTQSVAKESQSEARRLAAAIETLNSDRDRLYARVAVLEQGLDSVTGTIARQSPAVKAPQPAAPVETPATAQKSSPAPVVSPLAATLTTATAAEKTPPVATAAEPGPVQVSSAAQPDASAPAATPAMPLVAAKSVMAPPDPAAGKLIEPSPPPKTVTVEPIPEIVVASTSPLEEEAESASATPGLAVQRTEFGVDVGGANSLPGLRALWRGLLKSRSNAALTTLRPIIVIKEGNNGLGMQLRLVAGPINDAAAAAKICAGMIENNRTCATTVFEGQRLSMNANEPATTATDTQPAAAAKPFAHKRYAPKRAAKDEPAQTPEPSTLSQIFGRR